MRERDKRYGKFLPTDGEDDDEAADYIGSGAIGRLVLEIRDQRSDGRFTLTPQEAFRRVEQAFEELSEANSGDMGDASK